MKLGATTVIRELDIFSKLYSRGIPYDEFVEMKVKGGKVYINGGNEAKDAIKNGKLIVDFVQGPADNPKVNGIVLVQGGKDKTHFESHRKYIKVLEDLKNQQ